MGAKKNKAQQQDVSPRIKVQKTVKAAREACLEGQAVTALQLLAEAFEALDDAKGIDPWAPALLVEWSESQTRDAELAALFVLSIGEPEAYGFPMHEALQNWDEMAMVAFATWATKPWWAWPKATTAPISV